MCNRVKFFESISAIEYPQMLVDFFDHFIALKNIVEESNSDINVCECNESSITFDIVFKNKSDKEKALLYIKSVNYNVTVYNRLMRIEAISPTDLLLKIKLV